MKIAMTMICVWMAAASTNFAAGQWALDVPTTRSVSTIRTAIADSAAMILAVLVSVFQGIAQAQTRSVSLDVPRIQSNCRQAVLNPNVILAQWSAQTVNLSAQIMGLA